MFHVDLTPFGVDMDRLKNERLARLQAAMASHGLGALLLTDPLNIRYATNSVLWLNMRATGIQRFAIVPAKGTPHIYERPFGRSRAEGTEKPGIHALNSFMFDMRSPVATEHFSAQVLEGLSDLGLASEPLGVDSLNLGAVESLRKREINVVDGLQAVLQARRVKTVDEIQLMRWTTQTKFGGYDMVRAALNEGPAAEERLNMLMLNYLLDRGFEAGSEFIVIYDSSHEAERPHQEPMGTDLIVTEGDLVIVDATVAGPGGYYSDFARTYSLGNNPSDKHRARYAEAYDTLQAALPLVKPGPCTELFERFGRHATARLPGLDGFHGVGMSVYETPWLRGWDPPEYEVTLEEDMVLSLEINHYPVKLEHIVRVTASGPEILSTYPIEPELVPA